MRLTGKEELRKFKQKYPLSRSNINSWIFEIEDNTFINPHQVKEMYPSADFLGKRNTIFDISGNKYRLWAQIHYKLSLVHVIKIGTHTQYDKWEFPKK
jgi:mRNA interferase HigB